MSDSEYKPSAHRSGDNITTFTVADILGPIKRQENNSGVFEVSASYTEDQLLDSIESLKNRKDALETRLLEAISEEAASVVRQQIVAVTAELSLYHQALAAKRDSSS